MALQKFNISYVFIVKHQPHISSNPMQFGDDFNEPGPNRPNLPTPPFLLQLSFDVPGGGSFASGSQLSLDMSCLSSLLLLHFKCQLLGPLILGYLIQMEEICTSGYLSPHLILLGHHFISRGYLPYVHSVVILGSFLNILNFLQTTPSTGSQSGLISRARYSSSKYSNNHVVENMHCQVQELHQENRLLQTEISVLK